MLNNNNNNKRLKLNKNKIKNKPTVTQHNYISCVSISEDLTVINHQLLMETKHNPKAESASSSMGKIFAKLHSGKIITVTQKMGISIVMAQTLNKLESRSHSLTNDEAKSLLERKLDLKPCVTKK